MTQLSVSMLVGETDTFTIIGENFAQGCTTVTIAGVTVNSILVNNPTNMTINITAGDTSMTSNVIIENGGNLTMGNQLVLEIFPASLIIYDSFTGIDGTLIEDHISDTGHSWSAPNTSSASLIGNQLKFAGTGSPKPVTLIQTPVPSNVIDYDISVKFTMQGSSGMEIILRAVDPINYIVCAINNKVTAYLTLFTVVNGVLQNYLISSNDVSIGTDIERELKVEIRGDNFEIFYEGVSKGSTNTTLYANNRLCGLKQGQTSPTANHTVNEFRVDKV